MVVDTVEISHALTNPDEPARSELLAGCPRCDEPGGKLPAVKAGTLGDGLLRRCLRCGTRVIGHGTDDRYVFSCNDCGLPFPADDLLPHSEFRCPECCAGQGAEELPDKNLAHVMEGEVRRALGSRWEFVTSPNLTTYLQRLVTQIARRFDTAPPNCRVVLVDDWSQRTLALPSGVLLISLGSLAFLKDEAELVFLLGHELAHAASGEAAVRLVRLGYHAAASEHDHVADDVWTEAVLDLVRLGYGRRRERDADIQAMSAVLAMGYDPASVLNYLRRLSGEVKKGNVEVSEIATAHTPAEDRIRRLERKLFHHSTTGVVPRVNRELFRRATGPQVLRGALEKTTLDEAVVPDSVSSGGPVEGSRGLGWTLGAIALITVLIVVVGVLLA
jgi:hypothetical protein